MPYQDYFSETFEDLIKALTHKLPKLRLGNELRGGAAEVKRHPFFKNVNWDDYMNKRVKPPIIPDPEIRKCAS